MLLIHSKMLLCFFKQFRKWPQQKRSPSLYIYESYDGISGYHFFIL
jgi:hypothetical protein